MSVEEDDDGGGEGTRSTLNFRNSLADFDRPIENGEFAIQNSIEESSYCCVVHVVSCCVMPCHVMLCHAMPCHVTCMVVI